MTMASGGFGLWVRDSFNRTRSFDLDADTLRNILVTNTYTPNFTTHDEYADVTNEVTGTGYTATGVVLASVTSAVATGVYTLDAADSSWTTASFTARGRVVYDDTITGDGLVLATTFGADYTVTVGTFTQTENASGLLAIDYDL